ncbi:Lactose transport system permease protein LacF [Calidithermus terrae]|uniref:Lactose transport system permease protein LacF n=1 Tax=Calidithermus terrae TaxID=1408545 RepID=A0A399F6I7_9DEIN|nr:sugar ABC transporter permease [Calidithermus terrae]RIH90482.1 Lactose transport system permease protein LacF [Calidithermus terrae]
MNGLRLTGLLGAAVVLGLARLAWAVGLGGAWLYGALALVAAGVAALAVARLPRRTPLTLAGGLLVPAGAGLGYLEPWLVLLSPLGALLAFAGAQGQLSEREQASFWGWLLVWPAVGLLLVWQVLPAFYALWLSFLDRFNFIGNSRFVGLLNYEILLTRDPLFWKAMSNTFWFVAFTVPAGIGLATLTAILLNEKVKLQGLFRTLYFLPYITALTAAAAVWDWIYNPEFGFLNWLLGTPGFQWLSTPEGIFARLLAPLGVKLSGFWAGPSVAFVAVMVMSVWHFLGYQVVVLLAGLQNIPKEYYEAAELDGASWWQKVRFITWPLLSPTTFFLFTLSLIGAFQVFTQVLILTPTGGVLQDTLTIALYLYNKGFRDSNFSYASALAVVVFVVILVLTLVQRRVLERRVTYEA